MLYLNIANAQIEIRKESIADAPVPKPEAYDSLRNFVVEDGTFRGIFSNKKEAEKAANKQLLPYVGQKVFFLPKTEKEKEKNGPSFEIDKLRGHYYVITDFSYKFFSYGSEIDQINVSLKSDSGITETYTLPTYVFSDYHIMCVGYYEKLKELSVGKEFVYTGTSETLYASWHNSGFVNDINTGEELSLKKGSVWRCSAVQLIDDEYFHLFCIFNNSEGKEIKVRIKRVYNDNFEKNVCFLKEFQEKESYDKEKKLKQLAAAERQKRIKAETEKQKAETKARNNVIIAKYGQKLGSLIVDKQVVIGMTKEMCTEAWGKPYDINTTIVAGSTSEQWCYSMKTYLYFTNGILTAIQK